MLTHKGTCTIETNRLLLRKASLEDAQAMFCNWASDPDVTRFLTWPAHASVEVSQSVIGSWLEAYARDDYYQWMIAFREKPECPIGSISVVNHEDKTASAEIGYCIGKDWWHQGIMTEALGAVMKFLFEEVGMNRIEAKHDVNNPHSGAVMRKCAMEYEGTARSAGWNNQGICDIASYARLKKGAADRKTDTAE